MFITDSARSMRRALGLAVAAAALIGACSSSATAAPAATSGVAGVTSAPSVAATPEASTAAESGGSVYTVAVATKSGVGSFLTGEDGKTLYTFKKDTANTSNCSGGCATSWPPFTLDPGETVAAGAGVTVKLDTIKRADGSTQVTADGMPLYYFAKDSAAGDVNGQGVGGVWFVASPTSGGAGAASPSAAAGVSY